MMASTVVLGVSMALQQRLSHFLLVSAEPTARAADGLSYVVHVMQNHSTPAAAPGLKALWKLQH
jgi:hypothetical protein